jgi:hypothetical protein
MKVLKIKFSISLFKKLISMCDDEAILKLLKEYRNGEFEVE